MSSYRKKKVELEITVTNEDIMEKIIKIENEVLNEFTFPEAEISLKASETKKVILTKEWQTPVVWSLKNPHLYNIKTSLTGNGEIIDYVETRFGFREFWIENGKFFLNGIPITLRGSSKHLLGDPWTGNHPKDAEETLKKVLAVNSNALRLHANPYPEVFLDTADEMGVLIIDESALWCLSHQYDLGENAFWENAQEHIKTLVKRDRNHPSLVIWSVENEILLCGGDQEERCKKELITLGDIIKQLDPTRPIMYEGDFDLPNADIINLHYPHEYPEWTVFPNEAYFLDNPVIIDSYPRTEFLWDRKKPLYIGEFLWIPPFSPHPHTIFYGDKVYTDFDLYRKKAKAQAWKMYVEAFRSQGVNGVCPWNVLEGGEYPTPLSETVTEVFQPLFGFVKEYTTHFFSGQTVERTLVVCNGTAESEEVIITWSAPLESGEVTVTLGPTENTEVKIMVTAPHAGTREFFNFSVSIMYDSQVYEIKKVYEVFPKQKFTVEGRIALYDPVGETRKILDENGITYELLDALELSSEYDLFIVGYHCLEELPPAVGEPVHSYRGNILCFEQETLSFFGLGLTDHSSSITFERTPVFDLQESDIRFWQEDNVVSRKDIAKPTSGNYIPLIDSGGSQGLEYTCLLEYYHTNGRILFCQLLLTEKYDTEPVASLLLEDIITYAITAEWSPRKLGIIGDGEFFDFLNVEYEKVSNFENFEGIDVLFLNKNADPEKLRSFVFNGGIVWLSGLEPEQITPYIHLEFAQIQYRDLPILLLENELTHGLSNQDFYWTGEREGWWTPLAQEIAQYSISRTSAGIPLTQPCILLKAGYGKGFFIVDMLQWEYNPVKSARFVSIVLQNLGISMRKPHATIQAETMSIEEVYLGERGDQFYAFYTEGYLGTTVTFSRSGLYTFRVYAQADVVDNEGALLEILIDRIPVGTLEVTSAGVYEIDIYVEKGIHEVGIAFTNDYWNPPQDRNLYVDKLEISLSQRNGKTLSVC